MWSVGPNKAGSQFVIYTRDVPVLDGGETVFGKCAEASLAQTIVRDTSGTNPNVTINQIRIGRQSEVGRLADLKAYKGPSPDKADPTAVYAVQVAGAPIVGVSYAKVTLVVSFDYGDPFSYKLRPTLAGLQQRYGDDLRIAYRFFPLETMHGARASIGARAACAAHMLGHFADMDAALWASYEARGNDMTDDSTATDTVTQMARRIGLDTARFKEYLGGPCIQRVGTDQSDLSRVGQRATPTSWINGRYLSGARPIEMFIELIDEELAKANQRILKQGSNQMTYYQDWVIAKGLSAVAK
jgi:predicted DsbA family dithiol-disulfide isomerase